MGSSPTQPTNFHKMFLDLYNKPIEAGDFIIFPINNRMRLAVVTNVTRDHTPENDGFAWFEAVSIRQGYDDEILKNTDADRLLKSNACFKQTVFKLERDVIRIDPAEICNLKRCATENSIAALLRIKEKYEKRE